MTDLRAYVVHLLAVITVAGLGLGCQMHRWVYIRVTAGVPGASVRSAGLPAQYKLQKQRAPAGHFMACTPADLKAEVLVSVPTWTYIIEVPGRPRVRLPANREALGPFCAKTMDEAQKRPFVVQGALSRPQLPRKTLEIRVETEPPGATVTDLVAGKALGRTPLRVALDAAAPRTLSRWLLVQLAGYRPLRVQLDPAKGLIRLRLTKLPPAAAPRKRPPAGKKNVRPADAGPPDLPATRPRD